MSEPVKSGPHFIRVASSVAANTATVLGDIFVNPTHSSTVNLYIVGGNDAGGNGADRRTPVRMTPFYKWLTGWIFVVAFLCLLLQFFAAGYLFPEPTATQANLISNLDWGWKMGFGLVIGLLGGKVVP